MTVSKPSIPLHEVSCSCYPRHGEYAKTHVLMWYLYYLIIHTYLYTYWFNSVQCCRCNRHTELSRTWGFFVGVFIHAIKVNFWLACIKTAPTSLHRLTWIVYRQIILLVWKWCVTVTNKAFLYMMSLVHAIPGTVNMPRHMTLCWWGICHIFKYC